MRTMSTPPTKVMNLSLCFKGFYEWSDEFLIEMGAPYHLMIKRTTEISRLAIHAGLQAVLVTGLTMRIPKSVTEL